MWISLPWGGKRMPLSFAWFKKIPLDHLTLIQLNIFNSKDSSTLTVQIVSPNSFEFPSVIPWSPVPLQTLMVTLTSMAEGLLPPPQLRLFWSHSSAAHTQAQLETRCHFCYWRGSWHLLNHGPSTEDGESSMWFSIKELCRAAVKEPMSPLFHLI